MDGPGSGNVYMPLSNRDDTGTSMTDIFNAVHNIDQKSGASTDAPPDQPVPPTSVTAVAGGYLDMAFL